LMVRPMRPRVALLALLALLAVLLFSIRRAPVQEQAAGAAPDAKTVLEKSPKPRPPAPAPVPLAALAASMQRGLDYLVKNQNKDGSWGGPSWKGGAEVATDIPGSFRSYTAAVTALCVEALIDAGDNAPKVQDAIKRGEAWLLEHLHEVRQDSPE